MVKPPDMAKLVRMEKVNREVGALIGESIKQSGGGYGFALFMVSFGDGPEMTWISNARSLLFTFFKKGSKYCQTGSSNVLIVRNYSTQILRVTIKRVRGTTVMTVLSMFRSLHFR